MQAGLKAARYWQLAGNTGLALSSFLLAYLLLQYAPAAHYGSFTFVLVLQALGMALCNALVASPLLILMNNQRDQAPAPAALKGFLLLGSAIATVVAALQGLYLWLVLADCWLSVTLALAGWLQLVRWYGRCEWQNRDVRVLLRSDLAFSVLIFLGAATLWWFERLTLQNVGWLLLLVSLAALLPFIAGFLMTLRANADWQAVKLGFRLQGKPALFGVLTVEATANFHSYLVVVLSGSIAFAPLAAAMLFFRPLAVVLGSLQQSERPLLVRALAAQHLSQDISQNVPGTQNAQRVQQLTSTLRRAAFGAFALNTLALLLVFLWLPEWLWPQSVSRGDFSNALILWGLIALLRALRSPATALLQAADQFAPLARATYASAMLTVPAVLISWWLAGPVASLLGVLAGELLLGWLLLRLQQQFLTKKPHEGGD